MPGPSGQDKYSANPQPSRKCGANYGDPTSGGEVHTQRDNKRVRLIPSLATVGMLAMGGVMASACGSSGESASAACQRIAEVLDMSPEQSSDPSGFALFQVKPLSKIQTSDGALQSALKTIVPADKVVASANPSATALAAATKVEAQEDTVINGQCPGLGI